MSHACRTAVVFGAAFWAGVVHVVNGQAETTVRIDPSHTLGTVSRYLTGACLEDVNHEVYGGLYSQMIDGESFAEPAGVVSGADERQVSRMWRWFNRGTAAGAAALVQDHPFVGVQCQQVSFLAGQGAAGIENRGLNRHGMAVVAGKPYEGHLWARAQTPVRATVSLAAADGLQVYASASLSIADPQWHRYDFTLTPNAGDPHGRFEFALTTPGSVRLGYVFLQPGAWGRFHDLPVRRDVAEALIDQGVTVMRYGGSMVNAAEYRWKQMIGDRDRRPPYRGHWFAQSSNGWGVIDFLNFAEAAGILPVPDLSIDETPEDMADFLEYVNGPADSPWGRRRVADGHPAPYRLKHLELGNEERVDAAYAGKFTALARAIWSHDPSMVLTVGDFEYKQPITDPMHVTGATSGITDLTAHREILRLAKSFGAEVWFDVHVWTDTPFPSPALQTLPSYVDAIDQLAAGAKHNVVVFELNANSHGQARALANAQALIRIEQDGRIPVVASANCLQVDGQNDNGWDQGLLFLNGSQVWLQPPGYALQMFSRYYQPVRIHCHMEGEGSRVLEAVATTSADGKSFVLQVVNPGAVPMSATLRLAGADVWSVRVRTLAGDLAAVNPAERPDVIRPQESTSASLGGMTHFEQTFTPHSLTIVRWQLALGK